MNGKTIYQFATRKMNAIVAQLLKLSEKTAGFTEVSTDLWQDETASTMLLCGKGLHIDQLPAHGRANVWLSRSAIPFDIELAATGILYRKLLVFTDELIADCFKATNNFESISEEWIYENPNALPVITHVAGTFSKQELSKLVGSVSDTGVSRPAAKRIAVLLKSLTVTQIPKPHQIRERIRATTEGIVRDLVGRLLLEDFVAFALRKANVPYRREEEYASLSGVVYDFRADFVVPDELSPKAFLEVRKSSSRHASLYAKDKMFSAINWKGKHQKCLGILVVDGPWTTSVLNVMAKVFDYVVPIGKVGEVCDRIRNYLDGDDTVLQWLIHFRIEKS